MRRMRFFLNPRSYRDETITVPACALLLGMSVKTIYHWIYLGKLKAFKHKGHWRVLRNQKLTRGISLKQGV